ncbi:MAG: hypothetical protein K9M02_08015 [Thiohalocapsa sp.]|nr:hypothetical protein [Thiohalocapsa sp.]
MDHSTITFSGFLTSLWDRRWAIVLITAVSVAVAAALSFNEPTVYTARATVLIDFQGPLNSSEDPTSQLAAGLQDDYLTTQLGIIASRRVADRVVENLDLDAAPEWQKAFEASPAGGDIKNWIGGRLLSELSVTPGKNSRLVEVAYRSADPEQAAQLANAFAAAYEQIKLEMNTQPVQREAQGFERLLAELRQNVVDAQNQLTAYEREHDIIVTDDRLDLEAARLQELLSRRVDAESEYRALEARLQRLEEVRDGGGSLEGLPEVLTNDAVRDVKRELNAKESEFAQIRQDLGRNHPQYQSTLREVEALRARLAGEINAIVGSIENQLDQARTRAEAYLETEKDHEAKIMSMKQARDQLSVLIEEQRSAQSNYDQGLARYNQFRTRGRLTQTNVQVLNPALVPAQGSGTSKSRTLLLAALLGLLLGIAYAVIRELLDRRIRTQADAESMTGGNFLGTLPKS